MGYFSVSLILETSETRNMRKVCASSFLCSASDLGADPYFYVEAYLLEVTAAIVEPAHWRLSTALAMEMQCCLPSSGWDGQRCFGKQYWVGSHLISVPIIFAVSLWLLTLSGLEFLVLEMVQMGWLKKHSMHLQGTGYLRNFRLRFYSPTLCLFLLRLTKSCHLQMGSFPYLTICWSPGQMNFEGFHSPEAQSDGHAVSS